MRVISLTIPVFNTKVPNFYMRDFFLSNDNRFQSYFDNYLNGKETIGTWLIFEWLSEMSRYLGFDSCTLKVQPEYQRCSDFRFDVAGRL